MMRNKQTNKKDINNKKYIFLFIKIKPKIQLNNLENFI